MKKMRKGPHLLPIDILIIFLIAAAGIFLTVRGLGQKGSRVVVNAAGVKYEYSVSQNGTYTVSGELGPTTFEIKDGRVRITDSPCPNKICISQGWHNPLVCLPNKVMITVENETGQGRGRSNEEAELDAVSE
jgi:hypothetical protein